MVNNIPVNGWPQLKDLEAVQPTLDRLDKIEAWKRTVKEETFTGDDITIENALALPARSLKTAINAIQDLHGYDHPWVGGADINYLDLKARFPDNAKSVTSDGITYTRVDDTDGNPLGVQASNTATGYSYCDVQLTLEAGRYKSAVTGIEANKMSLNLRKGTNREYFKAANEEFTLTEQTLIWVRFTVNQGDSANNTIKCMIYKYDGTDKAFRPYSNICPISGRTAVNLGRTGKNLFNVGHPEYPNKIISYDSGLVDNENFDTYHFIGGYRYVLSFKKGTGFDTLRYGLESNGIITRYNSSDETITINALDIDNVYISISHSSNYASEYQMEIGTAATPYEAPQIINITIALGQTVYGAEINWDTGVMTVTHALVDLASISWAPDTLTRWESAVISNMLSLTGAELMDSVAEEYSVYTLNQINGQTSLIGLASYARRLYVRNGSTEDTPTGKVIYLLATPTTIQLTPEQLEMLKGYNHITLSDGYGTIELKALTGANWS